MIVFASFNHGPNHSHQVPARGANSLVVGLSFISFPLVVRPRLLNLGDMAHRRRHHGHAGTPVHLTGRLVPLVTAGTVVQRRHAQVHGQTAFGIETVHGADLSDNLAGIHNTEAGKAPDPTAQRARFRKIPDLLLKSQDPLLELQDLPGVLNDHGTHVGRFRGETGFLLPDLDLPGKAFADPPDLEKAPFADVLELLQPVPATQKTKEGNTILVFHNVSQTRAHRPKVRLHPVQKTNLFVHQLAPASGQPLEHPVGFGHLVHLLQYLPASRQRTLKTDQFHDLPGVDGICLGRTWKKFLEAPEFEVVHVQERVPPFLDFTVQRPGIPIVAFHGHHNGNTVAPPVVLQAAEKSRNPSQRASRSNSSTIFPPGSAMATRCLWHPTSTPTVVLIFYTPARRLVKLLAHVSRLLA